MSDVHTLHTAEVDFRPRLGIVGLGLIGSSIGLAARAAGWRVVGCDITGPTASRAKALGAVDALARSIDDLRPASVDLVVVAVPPSATVATVLAVVDAGARAVTDVASAKRGIVDALAAQPAFSGGHPMAGGDRSGPDAARADLFRGATWLLTPSPATSDEVTAAVLALVRAVGARPVSMDAARHDRVVARVSHVPHLAAAALVAMIGHDVEVAEIGRCVGSGWRDTTRIAAGNPALWTDILCANADLVAGIDAYVAELLVARERLLVADADGLQGWLRCAADARPVLLDEAPRCEPSAVQPARVVEAGASSRSATSRVQARPRCTCTLRAAAAS